MKKKTPSPEEETSKKILEQLVQAQYDLELAYANFEVVVEPELVDAYIYEVNAVQKRYCFLLRQLRGISREAYGLTS